MKKSYAHLFFGVILCFAFPLFAQFPLEELRLPPADGGFNDLGTISGTLVRHVPNGTFYLSTDGGITWTPGNMPSNGGISNMLIGKDGKLYIDLISGNDLFVSSDLGETWQEVENMSQFSYIVLKFAFPSGVLLGYGYGSSNLIRSTDGGSTWTIVADSLHGLQEEAMAYDEVNDRLFFSADRNEVEYAIFKSDDQGLTWEQVYSDTLHADGSDYFMAIGSDHTIYSCGDYDTEIRKSSDGGISWSKTQIDPLLWGASFLSLTVSDANHIFCILYPTTVYQSGDGGNTWNVVPQPWGKNTKKLRFVTGAGLFATINSNYGVTYRSGDDGISWQFANNGILKNGGFHSMAFENDDHFFALNSAGVFETGDAAQIWNIVYTAGPNAYFNSIQRGPGGQLFLFNTDTLLRSKDNAQTWQGIDPFGDLALGEVFSINPATGVLYLTNQNGYLLASHDAGNTWEPVAGDHDFFGYVAASPDGTVYAGRKMPNGLYWRSHDDFETLDSISVPVSGFDAGNSGFLIGEYDNMTYRSFDEGNSWDSLPSFRFHEFIFNASNQIFTLAHFIDPDWGSIDVIYYSLDLGFTWQLFNDHLYTPSLLFMSPGSRLYFPYGNVLLRTDASTVGSGEIPSAIQEKLAVFPNPFQNTLHFSMKNTGANWQGLRFELTDLQGRKLIETALGALPASVELPGIPAGAYVYTLSKNGELMQAGLVVKE